MRIPFRRKLQGVSFLVLAGVLAMIAFGRLHGSSLGATTIRITERVYAYGEPKPYEAHVFIPIRIDKQDHALSCEVATLKMVLDHRGVAVDESELIAHVGFDPTPKSYQVGRVIWGDPNEAFVGNIDGRMMVTGYGVHWRPIARVANKYRRSLGFEKWDADDLIRELQGGNPIVIWGCLGRCNEQVWYTDVNDQKPVKVVSYEHTFVVNGFNGAPDDVQGFWLIDPIYGRKYMELSAFMNMWETLDNSGVVVY